MPDFERRVKFTREPMSEDPFEIMEKGESDDVVLYDSPTTDMIVFDVDSNSVSYAIYWEDTEHKGPGSGKATTIGSNIDGLNQAAEELLDHFEDSNSLDNRYLQELALTKGQGTQRVLKSVQRVADYSEQHTLEQYIKDITNFYSKTT